MTGVEILSSETIYNSILPEWCIAIGFILLIGLVIPLSVCLANGKTVWAIICIILMIGSFLATILSDVENKHSINHIEYKVTIDDSVSMNEFLDKYEILDQEGKIYTVKERE